MRNKLKAAALVTVFFALVRPSEVPPMWATVIFGIVFYECALYGLRIHRQIQRERRIAQNVVFRKRDGAAIENEVFNPLKEVG